MCPQMAPGTAQPAHPKAAGVPTGWPRPHPLLPINGQLPEDSHAQGACIRMVALGPEIGFWEGALYREAKSIKL